MTERPTLRGTRVVTLAMNLPGPLAAARLAKFGAQVTKIEPPTGDPLDAALPRWYSELTIGQQIHRWDLKTETDRARLGELLADADLLLTAYRPSALARLGLDNVVSDYPMLSHIEIVGHDGEFAETPGHDLTYQAHHATLSPHAMPTVPVVDMIGAERAVTAALLALLDRARTGAGSRRRIVLEDAAVAAGAAVRHGMTGPGAPLGGADPCYGIYETADNNHIALAALEPHFRARVREHLGAADDADQLRQIFAGRSAHQWERWAARLDIPLAVLRGPASLGAHR